MKKKKQKLPGRSLIRLKKLSERSFLILFILSLTSLTYGQITIRGRITGSVEKEALPGVNVLLKGTATGTVTDLDGNYTLEVPNTEAILVFSYVGFLPEEVVVGNQTTIDITLAEDITTLEDVVVIGYGTMKKKDITGSVASIGAEELTSAPIASIDQGMQGKMAGVTLQQVSGAPGEPMKMRVRGGGSINYTNEPLYVIDGFVGGDLTSVQPQNIERIDILKDASATAIYGSRGANGVVLITTKTAKKGEFSVSLNAQYGISNQVKPIELLDAGTQAEYQNIARRDQGNPLYFTEEEVTYFKENGGEDYLDLITRTATTQNYNLTMSGGSDKLTYLFSGGYLNEEGLIHESFHKKYSIRSNITAEIKPWLDLKFVAYATHTDRMHVGINHRAIMDAYMYPTFWPNKDENGNYVNNTNLPSYGGLTRPGVSPNPVQYNEYRANGEEIIDGATANLDLTFKFTDYISFTTTGSGRYWSSYEGSMPLVDSVVVTDEDQSITQRNGRFSKIISTNNLTYKNTFGNHSVSLSGIYEYSDQKERRNDIQVDNLTTTGNAWHILGNGSPVSAASSYTPIQLQSVLGRLNYSYAGKYLFTGTVRRDQTSVFSSGAIGFFPSTSVGWVISEETFFSGIEKISNLKLRAGYGHTGNQAIGAYESKRKLSLATGFHGYDGYYTFDGVQANIAEGVLPEQIVFSSDIHWETQKQGNVGLDISLLGGKVNMSADYYNKLSQELIFQKSVAKYTGKNAVNDNFGSISNSGFEFMVDWRAVSKGDFTMRVGANLSINKNKVLDLNGEDEIFMDEADDLLAIGMWGYEPAFIVKQGQPLGLFYGIKSEGLYSIADSVAAAENGVTIHPGEHKYEDLNDDGRIDSEDRQVIGESQPDFTYGINLNFAYKNWNLAVSGFGSYGNEIYNYNRHYMDRNILNPDYKDRWTHTNQGAEQQRLPVGAQPSATYIASQYVENGSFFKINNVTLSYSFPGKWLEKVKISSLSLYANVNNLLTITKYSGVDPENASANRNSDALGGLDSFSYPLSRTWTFGFKTNF